MKVLLSIANILAIGSMASLGCMLRWWIKNLPSNIGHVPFDSYFPNICGCIVMGLMMTIDFSTISNNKMFNSILRTSITTGFCGSLTTFSSWCLSASEELINVCTQYIIYTIISINIFKGWC